MAGKLSGALIKVTPWVIHFIWLLFHGKLKTNEYLFHLKMGSNRLCAICGTEHETTEHLLNSCIEAQNTWDLIGSHVYIHIQYNIYV